MDGFYTKEAAARVLGISVRQINNYFNSSKLTRVCRGRRVWIPKAQVDSLYTRINAGPNLSQEEFTLAVERIEKLELQVDALKLGLGFGSKRPPRNETELLVLRQLALTGLSKAQWRRRAMAEMADELKTIQEEEVTLLINALGPAAWVPLVDLSKRMLDYIESHEDYPDKGLDILERRMINARDRFYGLIYASSKVNGIIPSVKAQKALEVMVVPVNTIERHIAAYMAL